MFLLPLCSRASEFPITGGGQAQAGGEAADWTQTLDINWTIWRHLLPLLRLLVS